VEMSLKNLDKFQSALFVSVIVALYLVLYTPIDVLQKLTILAFLVILLFLITLSSGVIEYGIEKENA
jgi:hypothetical protein